MPLQAYFNTAALAFVMVLPHYSPMLFLFFMGNQLGTMHPTLGHQSALASSGQSVLRAMTRRGGDHRRVQRLLARGLPWLPCYDRRDALVVKKVLDGLKFPPDGIRRTGSFSHLTRKPTHAPGATRSDEEYLALGFSAYVAALVADSGGDKVEGRTPREWLSKVMVMEDTDRVSASFTRPPAPRARPRGLAHRPTRCPLGLATAPLVLQRRGERVPLHTGRRVFRPEARRPAVGRKPVAQGVKPPTWLTVGMMIVFWLACFGAGAQFYLQLIVGAGQGPRWAQSLQLRAVYCICAIWAFFIFYVCNILPAMLTSQQGYVPHLPDFARRAHPHGYNVLGLVVNTFFWTSVSVADVTIYLFAMDAIEQWPHDGAFPLDLSQVPAERQQHFNLAMGTACIRNVVAHMLVASQAYHMLFCKGGQRLGQGAKGAYLG